MSINYETLFGLASLQVDLIATNELQVDNISSYNNSEIQLSSPILPSSTTIDLGSSTEYFRSIYNDKNYVNNIHSLGGSTITLNNNTSISGTFNVSGVSTFGDTFAVSKNTNGSLLCSTRNTSAGANAYSGFFLGNNAQLNGFVIFLNSSTRTDDGGANCTTVRSDAGAMKITAGISANQPLTMSGSILTFNTLSSVNYNASISSGLTTYIRNTSNSSSAYTSLQIGNDTIPNKFVIFTNSSTRTADGGSGNTTFRVDSGDLRIMSGITGNTNLSIQAASTSINSNITMSNNKYITIPNSTGTLISSFGVDNGDNTYLRGCNSTLYINDGARGATTINWQNTSGFNFFNGTQNIMYNPTSSNTLQIAVPTTISSNLDISSNLNSGGSQFYIRNLNAGTSASSSLNIGNNLSATELVIFTNSSTRSTDGGVGNSTIRTNTGLLNLTGATGIKLNSNVEFIGTSVAYGNLSAAANILMSSNVDGNSSYVSNQNLSPGPNAITTGMNISNDLGPQFTLLVNSSNRLTDSGPNTTILRSTNHMTINPIGGLLRLNAVSVLCSDDLTATGYLSCNNLVVNGAVSSDLTMGGTSNLYVASNTNSGGTICNIRNSNSGTSAYSAFTMGNDTAAGNFIIFQNSSTRSTDGGLGATTIRTDTGSLNISGASGLFINAAASLSSTLNVAGNTSLSTLSTSGLATLNSISTTTFTGDMTLNTAAKFLKFGPNYYYNTSPTSAIAGSSALPSNPVGFIGCYVNGSPACIPYYSPTWF